jgi:hypothetical protein
VEKEEDAYVEHNMARDVDELFSTTRIVQLYVHPGVVSRCITLAEKYVKNSLKLALTPTRSTYKIFSR